MKALLNNNKFHLLAVLSLFALFMLSIYVRKEKLEADLSIDHQEWISAHVLLTNQIWDEGGGPSNYHFSPVYSYDGKGSKHLRAFGGLEDENGDMYYVSYPPFAFILSYYTSKLLGEQNIFNIRALGLVMHFFCALFIYLIISKLSRQKKDYYSLAGVFTAFLYLFSSGTLWMHSILYFADMAVQIFIIIGLYLIVKLIQGDYSKEWKILSLLGITFFLGCYTEWLAVFISFFGGLAFLAFYFIKKKRIYLKTFAVLGVASALAVSLTIFQYSSIKDFETLKETSANKYEIRSGHNGPDHSAAGFDTSNPKSFDLLETNINRNFLMVINLIAIFYILLIPFIVWKKTRLKMTGIRLKVFLILILLISIFTHYYFFFNFNAIHNFSNLKTGFFMILCTGIAVLLIEDVIDFRMKIGLVAVLLFFGITRAKRDVARFDKFYNVNHKAEDRFLSAESIKKMSKPDEMAFSNMKGVTPEFVVIAHHMPFFVLDSSDIPFLMQVYKADTAQYYHHEGRDLKYILDLTLNGNHLNVVNKTEISVD